MTGQFLAAGPWAPAGLVLTWLIQSTVLLAAGLLAGRLLRKRGPAVQSALYRATLGAVILCPVASVSMAAMGFGGLLIRLPVPTDHGGDAVAEGPLRRAIPPSTAVNVAAKPAGQMPVPSVVPDMSIEPTIEASHELPMVADVPSPDRSDASTRWADMMGWAGALLMTAWLLGAAVLVHALAVGQRRMARLRSAAIDAEPDALALCRDLARRMHLTPPSVLRSPFLCSPCLDGVRRPAILLPEDAEDHLRETFIHELAHLERRDGLWNLLRHIATAVLWIQPLLWVLSKRLEATAEEVCDDYVVEYGADRCRYAGHLLELAERRLTPLAPSGVGMVSLRSLLARRIARILDSTRTLSTRAGRRAMAATLIAGLAGTLLVGSLGVGGGDRPALADEAASTDDRASSPTAAKTPKSSDRVTVNGRVVDPDGKPVAGRIRVRLMFEGHRRTAGLWDPELHLTDHPLDAEGRFRIDDLPSGGPYVLEAVNQYYPFINPEPGAFKAFEVAHNLKAEPGQVIALGTFNAATGMPAKEPEQPATENAAQAKDPAGKMPITGRIVDLEGRPVAGASVQITQITKPKGDNLNPWIESVKRGEPPWIVYNHLIYEPPITPEARRPKTSTDAQGRFRLDGIDAERVVDLVIEGPTISYTSLDVVTRRTETIPAKGFPSNYGSEAERIYGADFTYTAAPGRPIEGVVRDAATNQPLAGVQLVSDHFAGAVMSGITVLKTTTDAQGRFRLVGMPKGAGNKVTAVPNEDQPYFLQHVSVPDPPGMGPVQVDVALHKGLWIEGKVTEKQTGEPVPGARLHYFPFLENTFAQATPEFDRNGNGPNTSHQDRYQTKSDGTYRIVGLPGRAILGVLSLSKKPYLMGDGAAAIKGMNRHNHFETWRNPVNPSKLWPTSMKEINPAAATPVVHLDFQLNSGEKVLMRAVDLQGKPVGGLKLAGRSRRGRHEYDVKPEAEFDVVTLAPDEDRMVLIRPG